MPVSLFCEYRIPSSHVQLPRCSGPLKTRACHYHIQPETCFLIPHSALLMDFLNTPEKRDRRMVHLPMGRFGEAIEQAKAALFREPLPIPLKVSA